MSSSAPARPRNHATRHLTVGQVEKLCSRREHLGRQLLGGWRWRWGASPEHRRALEARRARGERTSSLAWWRIVEGQVLHYLMCAGFEECVEVQGDKSIEGYSRKGWWVREKVVARLPNLDRKWEVEDYRVSSPPSRRASRLTFATTDRLPCGARKKVRRYLDIPQYLTGVAARRQAHQRQSVSLGCPPRPRRKRSLFLKPARSKLAAALLSILLLPLTHKLSRRPSRLLLFSSCWIAAGKHATAEQSAIFQNAQTGNAILVALHKNKNNTPRLFLLVTFYFEQSYAII